MGLRGHYMLAHAEIVAKTWEEYVELHESFYLLEPLEEMWGRWVLFKCSCPGYFGGACCGHSSLLALLYDPSLKFPRELSSKQLPGRAGHSKKPSAWGEMHEEADASPATQWWAPRQLGANAMSISWEDRQVFLAFTSNSRMI